MPTDYIGAGKYIVTPERVVVGTDYGVQCVPRPKQGGSGWKAKLGSRCVGLLAGEGQSIVAACVKGLFVLTDTGEEKWGTHTFKDIVHAPLPLRDGIVITTSSSIHFLREWNGPVWRFDFSDVLGASVEQIRLVNLFDLDGHVVAGAVDYDSGIGRVVVINGKTGRRTWMSEPGPVSDLFPAGQAVFVWCQTGYGKFETRMTRVDGHEIWQKEFAGLGAVRPDGTLALVVGSNESPAWDDWEYRQVSPTGKVELSIRGNGRCAVRPLVKKDGTVYYLGTVLPCDLGGSRMDYTSFFAMPQEVVFQHLMAIRPQLPEYDVFLHRLRPGETSLEVIYKVSGSFSFAELKLLGAEAVFCDGQDIIGVEA